MCYFLNLLSVVVHKQHIRVCGKNKDTNIITMKAVLFGLVLSVFVVSNLASFPSMPYAERENKEGFKNAFLQYLMRSIINGNIVVKIILFCV